MESRIVIVAYKPKAGKTDALHQLMREHLSILKQQDLVTDRAFIIMEAKDGTIIEVFEWKSEAAVEQAHCNPAVLEMWKKYEEVCEFIPLSQVEESAKVFSHFAPFK
jgi:quinol monooxygenase YgiN